jgi:hypothetical protein
MAVVPTASVKIEAPFQHFSSSYPRMSLVGLCAQARTRFFKEQSFESATNHSIDVLQIQKPFNSAVSLSQNAISNGDFQLWLQEWSERPLNSRNGLRLAQFQRSEQGTLLVDRDIFAACFESFGLETVFLYLLRRSQRGFYHFHNTTTVSITRGPVDVFYVHTQPYSLLWSYHHKDHSTHAIFIPTRAGNCIGQSSQSIFRTFVEQLVLHKDHADNPYFLLFVCSVDTLQWLHLFLEQEQKVIRGVEARTGHSNWTTGRGPPAIEELSELSKSLGRSLTYLFNITRQCAIVNRMLSNISQSTSSASEHVPGSTSVPSTSIQHNMSEALALLQRELENAGDMNMYLQSRAKNQQSVVRLLRYTPKHFS